MSAAEWVVNQHITQRAQETEVLNSMSVAQHGGVNYGLHMRPTCATSNSAVDTLCNFYGLRSTFSLYIPGTMKVV